MFKKLKEKIKNITPKKQKLGTIPGTDGIIISDIFFSFLIFSLLLSFS